MSSTPAFNQWAPLDTLRHPQFVEDDLNATPLVDPVTGKQRPPLYMLQMEEMRGSMYFVKRKKPVVDPEVARRRQAEAEKLEKKRLKKAAAGKASGRRRSSHFQESGEGEQEAGGHEVEVGGADEAAIDAEEPAPSDDDDADAPPLSLRRSNTARAFGSAGSSHEAPPDDDDDVVGMSHGVLHAMHKLGKPQAWSYAQFDATAELIKHVLLRQQVLFGPPCAAADDSSSKPAEGKPGAASLLKRGANTLMKNLKSSKSVLMQKTMAERSKNLLTRGAGREGEGGEPAPPPRYARVVFETIDVQMTRFDVPGTEALLLQDAPRPPASQAPPALLLPGATAEGDAPEQHHSKSSVSSLPNEATPRLQAPALAAAVQAAQPAVPPVAPAQVAVAAAAAAAAAGPAASDPAASVAPDFSAVLRELDALINVGGDEERKKAEAAAVAAAGAANAAQNVSTLTAAELAALQSDIISAVDLLQAKRHLFVPKDARVHFSCVPTTSTAAPAADLSIGESGMGSLMAPPIAPVFAVRYVGPEALKASGSGGGDVALTPTLSFAGTNSSFGAMPSTPLVPAGSSSSSSSAAAYASALLDLGTILRTGGRGTAETAEIDLLDLGTIDLPVPPIGDARAIGIADKYEWERDKLKDDFDLVSTKVSIHEHAIITISDGDSSSSSTSSADSDASEGTLRRKRAKQNRNVEFAAIQRIKSFVMLNGRGRPAPAAPVAASPAELKKKKGDAEATRGALLTPLPLDATPSATPRTEAKHQTPLGKPLLYPNAKGTAIFGLGTPTTEGETEEAEEEGEDRPAIVFPRFTVTSLALGQAASLEHQHAVAEHLAQSLRFPSQVPALPIAQLQPAASASVSSQRISVVFTQPADFRLYPPRLMFDDTEGEDTIEEPTEGLFYDLLYAVEDVLSELRHARQAEKRAARKLLKAAERAQRQADTPPIEKDVDAAAVEGEEKGEDGDNNSSKKDESDEDSDDNGNDDGEMHLPAGFVLRDGLLTPPSTPVRWEPEASEAYHMAPFLSMRVEKLDAGIDDEDEAQKKKKHVFSMEEDDDEDDDDDGGVGKTAAVVPAIKPPVAAEGTTGDHSATPGVPSEPVPPTEQEVAAAESAATAAAERAADEERHLREEAIEALRHKLHAAAATSSAGGDAAEDPTARLLRRYFTKSKNSIPPPGAPWLVNTGLPMRMEGVTAAVARWMRSAAQKPGGGGAAAAASDNESAEALRLAAAKIAAERQSEKEAVVPSFFRLRQMLRLMNFGALLAAMLTKQAHLSTGSSGGGGAGGGGSPSARRSAADAGMWSTSLGAAACAELSEQLEQLFVREKLKLRRELAAKSSGPLMRWMQQHAELELELEQQQRQAATAAVSPAGPAGRKSVVGSHASHPATKQKPGSSHGIKSGKAGGVDAGKTKQKQPSAGIPESVLARDGPFFPHFLPTVLTIPPSGTAQLSLKQQQQQLQQADPLPAATTAASRFAMLRRHPRDVELTGGLSAPPPALSLHAAQHAATVARHGHSASRAMFSAMQSRATPSPAPNLSTGGGSTTTLLPLLGDSATGSAVVLLRLATLRTRGVGATPAASASVSPVPTAADTRARVRELAAIQAAALRQLQPLRYDALHEPVQE